MKSMSVIAASALAMSVASASLAHEIIAGDLTIAHPHIPVEVEEASTGTGQMVIFNDGAVADTLVDVSAPFAESVRFMHKMGDAAHEIGKVLIDNHADGEAFIMDDLYLVFEGINEPAFEGGRMSCSLVFERQGTVEIHYVVEVVHPTMEHDGQDHSSHEKHGGGDENDHSIQVGL